MGSMSKRKGAAGERELAKALNELLGCSAYRSQQYCGAAGDSDVAGVPGIHVESKRTEALQLYPAVAQAVSDAVDGDLPVVFHRRNGKPWVAICQLTDLVELSRRILAIVDAPAKEQPL